jgi:hypothetical protein
MNLSDLDFLKISISDVPRISSTLACEHLCEVNSAQARTRRLGMPCLLAGNVITLTPPYLYLEDSSGQNHVKLMVTRFLMEQLRGRPLDKLAGAAVVVLAVVWYSLGAKDAPVPEAFQIEDLDESSLDLFDATGFIRLRGQIDQRLLSAHYADGDLVSHLRECTSLGAREAAIVWVGGKTPLDFVSKEFVDRVGDLDKTRKLAGGYSWIASSAPNRIFDRRRLELGFIAKLIQSRSNLLSCFTQLVRVLDYEGVLPETIGEIKKIITLPDPRTLGEQVAWIRSLGLVTKIGSTLTIADRGFDAAYLATAEAVKVEVAPIMAVSEFQDLIQLEGKTRLAPSILMRYLEELENKGQLSRFKYEGHHTKLLWLINRSGSEQAIQVDAFERLKALTSSVLHILRGVSYALGAGRVAQSFGDNGHRVSVFSTSLLLRYMETIGLVTRSEDNGWIYPWKERVRDYLAEHPHEAFSLSQIIHDNSLPFSQPDSVTAFLMETANEILLGRWATRLAKDLEKKRLETILGSRCHDFILKRLETGAAFVDRIVSEADESINAHMGSYAKGIIDSENLCKKIVNEMIQRGELHIDGTFLGLSDE